MNGGIPLRRACDRRGIVSIAVTIHTGDFVAHELIHVVFVKILEATRTSMTIRALTVPIRVVELDLVRRLARVVDPKMPQAVHLGLHVSEQGVLRVAREASIFPVHSPVLKVCRGQVALVFE